MQLGTRVRIVSGTCFTEDSIIEYIEEHESNEGQGHFRLVRGALRGNLPSFITESDVCERGLAVLSQIERRSDLFEVLRAHSSGHRVGDRFVTNHAFFYNPNGDGDPLVVELESLASNGNITETFKAVNCECRYNNASNRQPGARLSLGIIHLTPQSETNHNLEIY